MCKTRVKVIGLLIGVLYCTVGTATVLRVDANATGFPIDGASWNTAFRTLQDAIAATVSGDEIWMAPGRYAPAGAKGAETFLLLPGISIYGGITPGASTRADRSPKNLKTTLSGDLNGNDTEDLQNREENSRHVVTLSTQGSQATLLDGLVITAGNASMNPPPEGLDAEISGGGITVTGGTLNVINCTMEKNQAMGAGAGMICTNATVNITDSVFRSNLCAIGGAIQVNAGSVVNLSRTLLAQNEASWGGAVRVGAAGTRLVAENCIFADNAAYGEGGAIYNIDATMELHFCTLSGNHADGSGGGAIGHWNAQTTIVSSILSGNVPDEIYKNETGTFAVANSIVAGGWEGGNLDVDPRFRLVKDPPYQPNWDSPAINAAQDPVPAVDFLGITRPQNRGSDIGAYEFPKDTDGGGLPDDYETANLLNFNDSGDDAADSDGDGLDNREEFRRGTDLRDPADPPADYYVAPTGDDEKGNGTEATPWKTIAHAMVSTAEGAPTFPVTIHLEPGEYEEKVVFRPFVRIAGAGEGSTTILYAVTGDDHSVVIAAEHTALRDCTVTFKETTNYAAELLRIDDVAMELSHVTLNGKDSPHTIAVFITKAGSSGSIIQYCDIKRVEHGVYAVGSGANVTRNLFEDILEGGVFIRPPEDKDGASSDTPVLGRTSDILSTGFNRFRMQGGFFVRNMTDNAMSAQYNDWGVYTDDGIQNRIAVFKTASVQFTPYIGSSLVSSSVVIAVINSTSQDMIPASAHPSVKVGAFNLIQDVASRLFLTAAMNPGSYACEAQADGYLATTQQATLTSGEITVAIIPLEQRIDQGGCAAAITRGVPPNGHAGNALLLLLAVGILVVRGKQDLSRKRKHDNCGS